jgi:hypothetical protein
MRVLLLGLAAALALVAAGGAWALSHQRYGELMLEWRWRDQVRGVKSADAGAGLLGIHIAISSSSAPQGIKG